MLAKQTIELDLFIGYHFADNHNKIIIKIYREAGSKTRDFIQTDISKHSVFDVVLSQSINNITNIVSDDLNIVENEASL